MTFASALSPLCRAAALAAAAGAFSEAREEVFGAPSFAEMVLCIGIVGSSVFDRHLTCLGRGPEFVIHDAQFRHLMDDPFLFRIWPRLALTRIWIFKEALAAPDQIADIHLVVEDAVPVELFDDIVAIAIVAA